MCASCRLGLLHYVSNTRRYAKEVGLVSGQGLDLLYDTAMRQFVLYPRYDIAPKEMIVSRAVLEATTAKATVKAMGPPLQAPAPLPVRVHASVPLKTTTQATQIQTPAATHTEPKQSNIGTTEQMARSNPERAEAVQTVHGAQYHPSPSGVQHEQMKPNKAGEDLASQIQNSLAKLRETAKQMELIMNDGSRDASLDSEIKALEKAVYERNSSEGKLRKMMESALTDVEKDISEQQKKMKSMTRVSSPRSATVEEDVAAPNRRMGISSRDTTPAKTNTKPLSSSPPVSTNAVTVKPPPLPSAMKSYRPPVLKDVLKNHVTGRLTLYQYRAMMPLNSRAIRDFDGESFVFLIQGYEEALAELSTNARRSVPQIQVSFPLQDSEVVRVAPTFIESVLPPSSPKKGPVAARNEEVLRVRLRLARSNHRDVFEIDYYPLMRSAEYLIPMSRFIRETRFVWQPKMLLRAWWSDVEATEQSSKSVSAWYIGEVVEVSPCDPANFPKSPWNSLVVNWESNQDGSAAAMTRVCPWEVMPMRDRNQVVHDTTTTVAKSGVARTPPSSSRHQHGNQSSGGTSQSTPNNNKSTKRQRI